MSPRTIWTVIDPEVVELTVIAEDADEARELAMRFSDDEDGDRSEYTALASAAGTHWTSDSRRWVGFESPSDAANQVRDLEAAGVDISRLLLRDTRRPGDERPIVREVGARDEDWCRLPAGVLCGGDE